MHSFAEVPRGKNLFNKFEIQIVQRADIILYLFKFKLNIFYLGAALDITLYTISLS